jgi:hypothetical protein
VLLKFCCYIYKRKRALNRNRAERDDFESFRMRNRLIDPSDSEVDSVTEFYRTLF